MGLEPFALLYLGFAALLTATLHSIGGFAGGLMLAIVAAPVVGIKATVPVTAVAMIIIWLKSANAFVNLLLRPMVRI